MALEVWKHPSGYNLGVFEERKSVNLILELLLDNIADIQFAVIAGMLPKGIRLQNNVLIGTPVEVTQRTDYKFVVRASSPQGVSDRTFTMTIVGEDLVSWGTSPGTLPVGTNKAYYIIDNGPVDFQLTAYDADISAGQVLEFFISSGDGELPPGLVLMPDGRITGFIKPLLSVSTYVTSGSYDDGQYDSVAFDFGYPVIDMGYDSEYAAPTIRKLNRNYEFAVSVSDGNSISKRIFRIFVVGDDFFKTDNEIMKVSNNVFTADITNIHTPVFTTPSYLGTLRANNYQTVRIETYNELGVTGSILYELTKVNATMRGTAQRDLSSDNKSGSSYIRLEDMTAVPTVGYKINLYKDVTGAIDQTYTVTEVSVLGGNSYKLTIDPALTVSINNGTHIYVGDDSVLPPGMTFDYTTGEIFGAIPYQSVVKRTFNFTIKASRLVQGESSSSRKKFTIDILGELDREIVWETLPSLGAISPGIPSSFSIHATSRRPTVIHYSVESGKLPVGIDLNIDGEIVGKIPQLGTSDVYKSYWKQNTNYANNSVVKIDRINEIKHIVRRRNTATVVTSQDLPFKHNDLIKINTANPTFNQYAGARISVDTLSVTTPIAVELTATSYAVTFIIPPQQFAPLAPVFTKIQGTPSSTASNEYFNIPVKSTTGEGIGAIFHISKASNSTTPVYNGVTTITVVNPGSGYLPNDTITISGSSLGGIDGLNDLTFSTYGLEFYYKIRGNVNQNYNGRFFATKSTTNSITLHFDTNPGVFEDGLISVLVGNLYEGQTQLTPLNYFSYYNAGLSTFPAPVSGTCSGNPLFYKTKIAHTSSINFNQDMDKWTIYQNFNANSSITTIDNNNTTFDNNTFDRVYKFTAKAMDMLTYNSITQEFNIVVDVLSNTHYSNISVKPLLKPNQRAKFKEFINNTSIFTPSLIYRPGDLNFGIQRDLKMLIFAGIETLQASNYIDAMQLNNKIKRFKLGAIRSAVAKDPGTNTIQYEVVYIEVIDPLENNKTHLPLYITKDDIISDQYATQLFPSSITNWRDRLAMIPASSKERNFLPLWMRSVQPGTVQELDYTPAIALCYCKPGQAKDILLNIKNHVATTDFDFKMIDYTIDRYTIDSVTGKENIDKYLVFRNDRNTLV